MGFTLKKLTLPFVKITPYTVTNNTVTMHPVTGKPVTTTTVTKTRTWHWHVGPWSYNSRTGQQTLKLPATVAYKSRTRTERAARRKARALRQANARAGWETYFTAKANGAPATAPAPTRTGKNGPKRAGTAATSRRRAGTAHAKVAGTTTATGPVVWEIDDLPDPKRGQYQATGMCAQPTADGTPCQRLGTCQPGTHAPRMRRSSTGQRKHR